MLRRERVGLILILLGVTTLILAFYAFISHAPSPAIILLIIAGASLLLVGFLLTLTALVERWLREGERRIVDGLQAG